VSQAAHWQPAATARASSTHLHLQNAAAQLVPLLPRAAGISAGASSEELRQETHIDAATEMLALSCNDHLWESDLG
jgi:hypothetical protein